MKILSNFFGAIGQYVILMGKVFSRPEKAGIYYRRILVEIDALGINSMPLVAIISIFIGAVITLQMGITLESPFIPKFMIGYATRETMTLEFSSTVIAIILAGAAYIAISQFMSSLTESQIISALLSMLTLSSFLFLNMIFSYTTVDIIASVASFLSIITRFVNFTKGIFSLSDAVYFISLTGLFLFFTAQAVEKRRWS